MKNIRQDLKNSLLAGTALVVALTLATPANATRATPTFVGHADLSATIGCSSMLGCGRDICVVGVGDCHGNGTCVVVVGSCYGNGTCVVVVGDCVGDNPVCVVGVGDCKEERVCAFARAAAIRSGFVDASGGPDFTAPCPTGRLAVA